MRFSIGRRIENGLSLIVLKDTEAGAEAAILPDFGALLHSFSIPVKGSSFNVIDHYRDLDDAQTSLRRSHKGPKLSPFACRIRDGRYRFGGRAFEFEDKFSDGSAIHGLLAKRAFAVVRESADETSAGATMVCEYPADDPAYPFPYQCAVTYTLGAQARLTVETVVRNESVEDIPLTDGWHPYFAPGGRIDDCELFFRAPQEVRFDRALIPTGGLAPNTRFLRPEKIRDTFLDNCFLLDAVGEGPACVLRNPANGLSVSFFPLENYPYLQIYTPPHRSSIAIENLSGAPDAFNNGMGLSILAPGASQRFAVAWQLSYGGV